MAASAASDVSTSVEHQETADRTPPSLRGQNLAISIIDVNGLSDELWKDARSVMHFQLGSWQASVSLRGVYTKVKGDKDANAHADMSNSGRGDGDVSRRPEERNPCFYLPCTDTMGSAGCLASSSANDVEAEMICPGVDSETPLHCGFLRIPLARLPDKHEVKQWYSLAGGDAGVHVNVQLRLKLINTEAGTKPNFVGWTGEEAEPETSLGEYIVDLGRVNSKLGVTIRFDTRGVLRISKRNDT